MLIITVYAEQGRQIVDSIVVENRKTIVEWGFSDFFQIEIVEKIVEKKSLFSQKKRVDYSRRL